MKRITLLLCVLLCALPISAGAQAYIAKIFVEDEISEYAYDYDHLGTLELLDAIIDDPENEGIFLYLNSPGGYMFETDELYQKIMRYKEKTGRGVYCYIGAQACSGALYVAMAADYIAAGRMSDVGDVGVYMETISYEQLYVNLGIEHNVLVTGENKLEGQPTLTQEHREIIMSRLEEALGFFVDVIASGRGFTQEQARALTDGRIFTATQAMERGLIDAVFTYDQAKEDMFTRFFEQELPMRSMQSILDIDESEDENDQAQEAETPQTQLFDWLLDGMGSRTGDGRILAMRRP